MAARAWLPLVAVWACLLPAAPGALAQASAVPPAVEARAWLARIHDAARSGNYRGTMVFAAGSAMSSSRVWHYCVGDMTYERMEALDGRQQRIYRVNDEVHTVWPDDRVAIVDRRDALLPVPTTPQAVDPLALDHYDFKREAGTARVAGRDAVVFTLEPRDELRFAQRLWADRATGLMLRADVLGPGAGASRAVLESAAFSEIEIGIKPPADARAQAMPRLDGYRVQRPQTQRTQLEAEGWTLVRPPAGFRLTSCVKRPLEMSSSASGGGEPVRLFNHHLRLARHHFPDHLGVIKPFGLENCQHIIYCGRITRYQQAARGLRIGKQVSLDIAKTAIDGNIATVTGPIAIRRAGNKTLFGQIEDIGNNR